MRTLESVLGPVDCGVMRHVDDECHVDDESGESECESSDDDSGASGAGSEGGSEAAEIGALMAAMDLELEQSRKGADFELQPHADSAPNHPHAEAYGAPGGNTARNEPADEAEAQPVDIDLNLVRNLLSSYSAQVCSSYAARDCARASGDGVCGGPWGVAAAVLTPVSLSTCRSMGSRGRRRICSAAWASRCLTTQTRRRRRSPRSDAIGKSCTARAVCAPVRAGLRTGRSAQRPRFLAHY